MLRCSVVIPTYNRAESLMRTLDALAVQTIPVSEFEVIVVSDGSTDQTDIKLQTYARSGKLDLISIRQDNAGPAAARNRGCAEARSEIIVFTDDDVEPVPSFLERHLSHHTDTDKNIVLGPLSPNPKWRSNEPVWIAWEHAQLQGIYNLFKPGGEFAGPYAGFEHFYSGNASLYKKWLDLVGGFSTEIRRQEDTEMAARIKAQADVTFIWDFDADGLHHPVRTLKSWLNIPVSYGDVDARRVASGQLPPDFIESNAKKRHKLTKALGAICNALPLLVQPLSRVLCAFASLPYAAHVQKPALVALSAAYNILYQDSYNRTMRSLGGKFVQARS